MSDFEAEIYLRSDTAAALAAANVTYGRGRPVFEYDTGRFKIGDGSLPYNSLPYASVLPSEYVRSFNLSIAGRMQDDEVLATIPIVVTANQFILAAGGTGISAVAGTTATASTTVTIKKNGSAVATIVWSAGTGVGTPTVASSVTFGEGDVMTIHAPAVADVTLANVGITISGPRA